MINVSNVAPETLASQSDEEFVKKVIEREQASKSEIKDASYQLKKIDKIKSPSIFSKTFLGAIDKARHYYLTQTGAIIEAIVPKIIINNAGTIFHPPKTTSDSEDSKSNIKHEKLIFQKLCGSGNN